jgi:hypothetical protein
MSGHSYLLYGNWLEISRSVFSGDIGQNRTTFCNNTDAFQLENPIAITDIIASLPVE